MKKLLITYKNQNIKSIYTIIFVIISTILSSTLSTYSQTFTLSDPASQVVANSAYQSDTKVPIYSFIITVSGASANLINFKFNTTGTYVAGDITNFKIWTNLSNSLPAATQIGSGIAFGSGSQVFTAFLYSLNVGVNYFWITMDLSAGAICNHTITVTPASVSSDMTTSATKAGATSAGGGTQTLRPVIGSVSYGSVTSGTAQSYSITGGPAGTTYSWSRALVSGISNVAVSGQSANPITETLINTTTTAIPVPYTITPTSAGCLGIPFTYTVSVNPVNTTTCPAVPAAPPQPTCASLTNLNSGGATTLLANTSYGFCGASFSTGGDINGASSAPIYVLSGQTLTISGNINSAGSIYVFAGATLILTGDFNTTGSKIYVYGALNHATSGVARVQGSPSTIFIGPTGIYTANNLQVNNSGSIINEGTMDVTTLGQFQGNTPILCLNNSGCMKVGTIGTISLTNMVTFKGSVGYIYSPETTCPNPNNNLTSSSDLKICSSVPSGPCSRFGSATVKYGCSPPSGTCAGAIALPITLTFFKATLTNEGVITKWGTNKQWDSDYFTIEKSKNGIDWEYVGIVLSGVHTTSAYKEFSITDPKPYEGGSYYRLSEVDIKGKKTVYAVDFVENDNSFNGFSIYPNPTTGDLYVNIFGQANGYDFELIDVTGKSIAKIKLLPGINSLGTIVRSPGLYIAKLKVGPDYFMQKIIVQ